MHAEVSKKYFIVCDEIDHIIAEENKRYTWERGGTWVIFRSAWTRWNAHDVQEYLENIGFKDRVVGLMKGTNEGTHWVN